MDFRFCPHCGYDLPRASASTAEPTRPRKPDPPVPYDQTAYWRMLHASIPQGAPPDPEELVAALDRRRPAGTLSPQPSVVHVLLDRSATPAGGALLQSVLSDGRLGPAGALERLEQMGYIQREGRIRQVDGIPVGRAYVALEYWGGARQHQRWHLDGPILLDPSRHGDPFFMDERCLAFGANWRDLDRFNEAMLSLIETLRNGLNGRPVGNPLVVDIHWSGTSPRRE